MATWRILAEDETIWNYEATVKQVWAKRGSTPRVTVNGSHEKIALYGALADDGSQVFRRYPRCNTVHFLDYCRTLLARYGRIVLFLDKAPWHYRSKQTKQFLEDHRDHFRVIWFPTGFPEANPVEECWRQGKYADTLGAQWHDSFAAFTRAVRRYYRTRRFNLHLEHYLGLLPNTPL